MPVERVISIGEDLFDVLANTHSGFAGTPLYMSPEALLGASPKPLDDLWALVLYEALLGRHPLSGRPWLESLSMLLHEGLQRQHRARGSVPQYAPLE